MLVVKEDEVEVPASAAAGGEAAKEEEGEIPAAAAGGEAAAEANDPDERSVFVKNVEFGADEASLIEHFKICGEIKRVTIRKDHRTGQPMG